MFRCPSCGHESENYQFRAERNAPRDWSAAFSMLSEGKTLKEVGLEFGVSAERVRQVAFKAGIRSFGSRVGKPLKLEVALELLRAGLTFKEAARQSGVSYNYLTICARKFGVKVELSQSRFIRENAAAFEAIQNGASIRSQSKNFSHAARLGSCCKILGIETRHGRWRQSKSDTSDAVST